jgi:Flp pilus assembly protein TadD
MSETYDLFQLGKSRLREGMPAEATGPLEQAKNLEPRKASIREALGIAYFRSRRWEDAEAEFRVLVELAPADHYAHYALGRSLERIGRTDEARGHLKLARLLKPAPAESPDDDRPTLEPGV